MRKMLIGAVLASLLVWGCNFGDDKTPTPTVVVEEIPLITPEQEEITQISGDVEELKRVSEHLGSQIEDLKLRDEEIKEELIDSAQNEFVLLQNTLQESISAEGERVVTDVASYKNDTELKMGELANVLGYVRQLFFLGDEGSNLPPVFGALNLLHKEDIKQNNTIELQGKTISDLSNQVSDSNEIVQTLTTDIEELRKANNEIKTENVNVKADYEALQKKQEELVGKVNNLENSIQALTVSAVEENTDSDDIEVLHATISIAGINDVYMRFRKDLPDIEYPYGYVFVHTGNYWYYPPRQYDYPALRDTTWRKSSARGLELENAKYNPYSWRKKLVHHLCMNPYGEGVFEGLEEEYVIQYYAYDVEGFCKKKGWTR